MTTTEGYNMILRASFSGFNARKTNTFELLQQTKDIQYKNHCRQAKVARNIETDIVTYSIRPIFPAS